MSLNELQIAFEQFKGFIQKSEEKTQDVINEHFSDYNEGLNTYKANASHHFNLVKKDIESIDEIIKKCEDYNNCNQMNPLEEVLFLNSEQKNSLLDFLKANNRNDFFRPKCLQKQNVLLKLINELDKLVKGDLKQHEFGLIYSWMEFAILDLDTQDRYVKNNGRPILESVLKHISNVGPDQMINLIYHLARSQLVDLNKK